jgi:hypothetical protein
MRWTAIVQAGKPVSVQINDGEALLLHGANLTEVDNKSGRTYLIVHTPEVQAGVSLCCLSAKSNQTQQQFGHLLAGESELKFTCVGKGKIRIHGKFETIAGAPDDEFSEPDSEDMSASDAQKAQSDSDAGAGGEEDEEEWWSGADEAAEGESESEGDEPTAAQKAALLKALESMPAPPSSSDDDDDENPFNDDSEEEDGEGEGDSDDPDDLKGFGSSGDEDPYDR